MLCGLRCVIITELWINRIWETWQSLALRNYDIHQLTREDHNEKVQSVQQGTYQKLKLVNTCLRLISYHCASPVQQNSFDLTTNNMEIQTVQLRWGSQNTNSCTLPEKMHHQSNSQISVTCSKMPPTLSVHQTLWYLLNPCLLIHQLLQIWRLQNKQKMISLAQN